MSGNATNGANGTVIFFCPNHGFSQGDNITIGGNWVYEGAYTLPEQTQMDQDHFRIVHEFVATNMNGVWAVNNNEMRHFAEGGVAVSNNDNRVNLPVIGHGFDANDTITVYGTDNYDGDYTLYAQIGAGPNRIAVISHYVPETFSYSDFVIAQADRRFLAADDATDLNGTVSIPCPAHGFAPGDTITIHGTTNYDGEYTLSDQSQGDADHIVITASYTAETFTSSAFAAFSSDIHHFSANMEVVDNGDGTVTFPCPGHGFNTNSPILLHGTSHYDGNYTLPYQGPHGDKNHFVITSAYTAETLSGSAYAIHIYKIPEDHAHGFTRVMLQTDDDALRLPKAEISMDLTFIMQSDGAGTVAILPSEGDEIHGIGITDPSMLLADPEQWAVLELTGMNGGWVVKSYNGTWW